ncbi:hypothetical protein L7F22_047817 [Adiantum nelumboides]|nr:hypothetical protein [Adiantum nelumboides]
MQDPYKLPNHEHQKPTLKSQRKQVGLIQPKAFTQLDGTTKAITSRGIKRQKKGPHDGKEGITKSASSPLARRPVVDMMRLTEGDSCLLYKALKRKYTTLEEESFKLAEELEKTDNEVKKLEEEKFSVLDELLMLEGLAYDQFPLEGQSLVKNLMNF